MRSAPTGQPSGAISACLCRYGRLATGPMRQRTKISWPRRNRRQMLSGKYTTFRTGEIVRHTGFGTGRVLHAAGDLIIVRFDHGIEQVLAGTLRTVASIDAALADGALGDPQTALARAQALAIRSV